MQNPYAMTLQQFADKANEIAQSGRDVFIQRNWRLLADPFASESTRRFALPFRYSSAHRFEATPERVLASIDGNPSRFTPACRSEVEGGRVRFVDSPNS